MKKTTTFIFLTMIIILFSVTQIAYSQKGHSPEKCVETANSYCVEIVPNEYEGVYETTRNNPLSRKQTLLFEVGKHSICLANNCDVNTITFEVGKGGEITSSNPFAITAANRKLEFNTVDFTIILKDYTDGYCPGQYRGVENREILCKGTPVENNPQIRSFKVVKNLNYFLDFYNEENDEIEFHVDADGQVSCISNAAAANIYGKSLQLKTLQVQINSKNYKGTVTIGNQKIQVPGTVTIVQNIATPFNLSDSKNKYFLKKYNGFIPEELIFSTGKKKQQVVFNFKCIKDCPPGQEF